VTALLDGLRNVVGADHVLTDPQVRAAYETDWTRRYRGESLAVVRPASTQEVAAVVGTCRAHGAPVVPQGGNTGLVAGAVPTPGSVVLSLRRLRGVGPVEPISGQVTVEAGVTLAELAAAVDGSGWEFGVDLGARDSATLGGMVATNAGGVRVVRHGSMRANVLGVEVVLADGSVVAHLDGLVKDNTGYDLSGLFCGSEGTLGVVTRARLRLVPVPRQRYVVWMACGSWAEAVGLASDARRRLDGVDGLEAVDAAGLALAEEQLGLPPLFGRRPEVALLVAGAGDDLPSEQVGELVGDRANVAATERPDRERLWAYRERQTEAIARVGIPHKLDVTLPLAELAAFTDAVRAVTAPHRLHLFGHLGDGNLHVNVVGPPANDLSVDAAVLQLVAEYGGSISAEHGIGAAKRQWLHLVRSPEELSVFRSIKHALDPTGLFNPGVLL